MITVCVSVCDIVFLCVCVTLCFCVCVCDTVFLCVCGWMWCPISKRKLVHDLRLCSFMFQQTWHTIA